LAQTGTLTAGAPKVQSVVAAEGFSEVEVLAYAAALEKMSEHPLARAIMDHARDKKSALPAVGDFESVTGRGVRGRIGGSVALLGNQALMQDAGIATASMEDEARRLRELGQTVMFVACG